MPWPTATSATITGIDPALPYSAEAQGSPASVPVWTARLGRMI